MLFVPACGQAIAVDMPAETDTPPTSQPTVEPAASVETAEPEPQGDKFVVTYIEDGDTIEVNTGERVRLIGIDTPEQSECGFEEASQRIPRYNSTDGYGEHDREALYEAAW